MGPILTGINGLSLEQHEVEVLQHPLVAGVILFSRNYEDNEQLIALTQQIKAISPTLLISVDHEGGRVQRFRHGFSAIPSMADAGIAQGKSTQEILLPLGFTLSAELRAHGIDFSFAPVLDINGISEVITNRAFSSEPDKAAVYAAQFISGMRRCGMKNVVKHFPGHGSVGPDSHIAMPIDERDKALIFSHDLRVFSQLMAQNLCDGVMPAHVIYSQCDEKPACFSTYWLQSVLRQQLQFNGVVFSDDLGMQGAVQMGDYLTRTKLALDAGCDIALLCNEPDGLYQVLDGLPICDYQHHGDNALSYLASTHFTMSELKTDTLWKQSQSIIARLNDQCTM